MGLAAGHAMHLVKTGHTQPGLDQAHLHADCAVPGWRQADASVRGKLSARSGRASRKTDRRVRRCPHGRCSRYLRSGRSLAPRAIALPAPGTAARWPPGSLPDRPQQGWLARFRAVGAQPAHQSLGLDTAHRRSHQEGFHAHVDQTREGAHRIVGMQGRKHQVTGERGLYGDLRRLQVAYLPDHDHIGILPQDRGARRQRRSGRCRHGPGPG